jgi:anti-sigma factor RsiW
MWASLQLDGELSELEEALLERHLEACALCAAFDAGLRASTELVRKAPLARPSVGFEVPVAKRGRVRPARLLAVAGVLGAAALGSIVGSTLDRPVTSPERPAAQVSFLTRDVSQLRQIPRGKQVAPVVPPHQPGGPPEGVI